MINRLDDYKSFTQQIEDLGNEINILSKAGHKQEVAIKTGDILILYKKRHEIRALTGVDKFGYNFLVAKYRRLCKQEGIIPNIEITTI
jgi:hypothetical protein